MEPSEQEVIDLPSGATRIEWRRNKQARRVSLRVDPRGGGVVITLPVRAARSVGLSLLINNAEWVAARIARVPGEVPFAAGATVPIHGAPHVIQHLPNARGGAWIEGDHLIVSGDVAFLRRRVSDCLRREAKHTLSALVAEKSAFLGVTPRRVTVRDTRSRWGSCASDGSLSFCWRLVMAPTFVQDYVVAHEVAHLRHMNHGKRFWNLVDRLTPNRQTAMDWLRVEGPRLLRAG